MDTEDNSYEVVISGISGKFPLSDDVEQLKENLLSKRNLVTEDNCRWDKEKWKVPSAVGKISVVQKFDDTFFGIYSGVAGMMDPLTRVTIERAFEAIMDAGINPRALRGSYTAVYTASGTSDSEAVGCDEKLTARFWLLAHVRALLANRISYVLNLKGPSWTIDSTWVGGIHCLKQAVDDIRKGRVDNALIGVTNVILFPEISQHWVGLGKLSPDGSCLPFDELADGYGRSEAVVFLFLQRENEANRIYAKVTHVDSMFCGDEANTLLKPKKEAFVNFLEKFYSTSDVPRQNVAYVEADGSADKYLDVIELDAIGDVLCKEPKNNNLLVGSVKSNVGHAEAAAPFVSLTKTLISLDSGIIPPNRYLQKPNQNIQKLKSNEMKVVTNSTRFPDDQFAAVNVIGLCSSIGHVLLQQHKKKKPAEENNPMPRLVLVSSRHEAGLLDIIDKLESMPYDAEYFSMVNNVFRESITGHFFRGFSILGATEKKIRFTLETNAPSKRPIWFVFAGMGSQWPGMGADLMSIPVFAAAMKELDSYLAPLGVDIVNVICSYDPLVLKNVVHSFVGIVAVQIGLVDILKTLGIEPDGMFGHSLGENMCAYADGCFSKYQTIMAAYYRGKASLEISVRKGLMASVGLNHQQLTNLPPNVEIACHNSKDNSTISGPLEDVQLYLEELKRQNVFVRAVNSNNVAYHSKQVQPLAPYVLENIRKIVPNPKKRTSRWISTSVPECDWNSPLSETSSAEYHVNNFLGTVYFAEACSHVPEDAIVIEISPHGLFQGILKRSLHESNFIVALGKRETSNSLNFLLSSIGKLYAVGLQPDVNAMYPPVQYPVSRGTPSLANLSTWNHEKNWEINTYHDEMRIKPLKLCLREPKWRYLANHKINEKIILPFAVLLLETLQAYNMKNPVLVLEKVKVSNFVEVSAKDVTTIYTQVQYANGDFEIVNNDNVLMTGIVRYEEESYSSSFDDEQLEDVEVEEDDRIVFTDSEIREVFKEYSMEFPEQLFNISNITFTDDGYLATIIWNENLAYFINSITLVKVFSDLCLQNRGPLLTCRFLRFAIETEKYNSLQKGTPIKIIYNGNRNVFYGPGFEMIGLENAYQLPPSKERQLLFQDLQFVPHDNPQKMSSETFLHFCGQIVGETFDAEVGGGHNERLALVKILLVDDFKDDKELAGNIMFLLETLYKELPHMLVDARHVNYQELETVCKNSNKDGRYFIICNSTESSPKNIVQLASNVEDFFLLTFSEMSKVPNDFVKITGMSIGKYEAILWKKKVPVVDFVIKIKPDSNEHWLKELEEDLLRNKSQKEVLVEWNTESITDVLDVISYISRIQHVQLLRYFVTMNAEQNSEYLNDPMYRQQLEKGLIINVYKDSQWGSIRHLVATNSLTSASELQSFIVRSKRIENINVEYIAACGTFNSGESQVQATQLFEFSGTSTTDQKRIMGIAAFNSQHSSRAEVFYRWSIPEKWSLEDAVTVPFVYVKAYYALIVRGKLCSRSSVLVHAGCSVPGEAAIAVSLNFGYMVYTTVSSSDEVKYLRERFNNSSHLTFVHVASRQTDVEVLKLTQGKGVDIVINADSPRQLQQSMHCLKDYGRVLQLSERPLQTGSTFGMGVFLKSTSVYGILDMDALKCDESVRADIQKWLHYSMKTYIVQPFKQVLRHSNDIGLTTNSFRVDEKTSRMIIKREVNSTNPSDMFFCNSEKSYLVIGSKSDVWFGIVTWLLEHNAKKIVFIEDDTTNFYNQYQKRFNLLLQNYIDVYLMHLSASTLKNTEDTAAMIQDVNKFAELDVVFCLSLDSERCSYVDYGLRKYAQNTRQLICLQCDGSKMCESRLQDSLPALNVFWDRSITDTAVLKNSIRKLIENSLRINSPSMYISDTSPFAKKLEYSLQNRESQFFPRYAESTYFFDSFSEKATFERVTSKCSEYDTRTQLFPVFILPGLHRHKLIKLIRKLMYPAFCAKFSTTYSSIRDVAKSLVEPLKKIQPRGPYTIVGESWSGAVAIELVSLLEKENPENQVKLILLEGIPKDMRNKLLSIGSFGGPEFLYNLRELCFEKEQLVNDQYWENGKQLTNENEAKFFELLQSKLNSVYHYSPENAFIRSKVVAIKLATDSILNTYIDFERHHGQDLDLEILDEVEYVKLIDSKETANIINDNVLFKW